MWGSLRLAPISSIQNYEFVLYCKTLEPYSRILSCANAFYKAIATYYKWYVLFRCLL